MKGWGGDKVRRSFGRGPWRKRFCSWRPDLTTGAEDLGGVGVLQGWAVSTDAARSRPTCVRYRGFKVAKVVCTSAGWERERPESAQAYSDRAVQDGCALGRSPAVQTTYVVSSDSLARPGAETRLARPPLPPRPSKSRRIRKGNAALVGAPDAATAIGDGKWWGPSRPRPRPTSPPPGNGVYLPSDPPSSHAGCFFFCSRPARAAAGRASGIRGWK